MQGAILVLIPAILISLGVSAIKFKYFGSSLFSQFLGDRIPIKLIVILILAILSTFIIDYIYCNVIQTQCEPDALAAVGYFFHAIFVFITSIVFEFVFTTCLQKYFKGSS